MLVDQFHFRKTILNVQKSAFFQKNFNAKNDHLEDCLQTIQRGMTAYI